MWRYDQKPIFPTSYSIPTVQTRVADAWSCQSFQDVSQVVAATELHSVREKVEVSTGQTRPKALETHLEGLSFKGGGTFNERQIFLHAQFAPGLSHYTYRPPMHLWICIFSLSGLPLPTIIRSSGLTWKASTLHWVLEVLAWRGRWKVKLMMLMLTPKLQALNLLFSQWTPQKGGNCMNM